VFRNLIEHSLNVDPKSTPKRQHLRRFTDDRRDAIKKELAKLLTTSSSEKSSILSGWRMCVDYTDLNKHCC
jgi:hypothetical protein